MSDDEQYGSPTTIQPSSLTGKCILAAAKYLELGTWKKKPWYYDLRKENPFKCFHPWVVQQIVNAVYKSLEVGETVRLKTALANILRPILLSGRLESFDLLIYRGYLFDAEAILKMLCCGGNKLKCFNMLIYSELVPFQIDPIEHWINLLLKSSVKLESLAIDINFDLQILQNLQHLHTIWFRTFPKSIRDIVSDDISMNNIKEIYLSDCNHNYKSITSSDVAFLVKHLPRLHFIQWDLAEPLHILHGDEDVETIAETYDLRKAYFFAYHEDEVDIFVRTCPKIDDLTIFIDNHDRANLYSSLINLDNVTHLSMKSSIRRPFYCVEYIPSQSRQKRRADSLEMHRIGKVTMNNFVVPVLSCMKGDRLKFLQIKFSIRNADLELLGTLCPNLEYLNLKFVSDVKSSIPFQILFPRLQQLTIKFYGDSFCAENLVLLASSPELTKLKFHRARHLTDNVLNDILNNTTLSKMQSLTLSECGLTERGLSRLIEQCFNLKQIQFSSVECTLTFSELQNMSHKINPKLRVIQDQ